MSNAALLDRVRKLLSLAKSDNVHEAAAAASKAQALITRYQLDPTRLDDRVSPTPLKVAVHLLWEGTKSRHDGWTINLACGVARTNRLRPYLSWMIGGRACIMGIGDPSDAETARFLIAWLIGEVERLYRESKPDGLDRGEGRAWANSFRLGCAGTIASRLYDAHREARELALAGPSAEDYAKAAARDLGAEAANRAVAAMGRLPDTDEEAGPSLVDLDRRKALLPALIEREKEHAAAIDRYAKDLELKKDRSNRGHVSSGDGYASGRAAGKRAHLSGKGLPS